MSSGPDAAGLIERVQGLLAKRRARDAEALCRQSIDNGEAPAEAWLALGLVFTSERRFDLAADAYRRSLSATVSPWACLYLALSLHELGETDAAIHEAGQAVAMAPDLADAHGTLATVLHGAGRSHEALASAEQALRLAPDSHVIVARLAAIRAQLGQFDAAEAAYRRAELLAPAFKHFGLIGFGRALWDDIVAPVPAVAAPEVVRESAAAPACPCVALASCDGGYFTKYAGSFLNSFAINAADTLLHLHVFDPGPGFTAELDALIERTGVKHYRVSVERAPVDSGDTKALRTYYSCGRFLILPQLIEQYGRPIVSLDIDATLTGSLEPLTGGGAFDIGLLLRKPLDAPWLDVIANVAVATPSAPSREYWGAVRGYLLHFMRRGGLHWHLDQVALYCVLKMAERYALPPSVRWFGPDVRETFWHVGHSHDYRMADARYQRYALPGAAAD